MAPHATASGARARGGAARAHLAVSPAAGPRGNARAMRKRRLAGCDCSAAGVRDFFFAGLAEPHFSAVSGGLMGRSGVMSSGGPMDPGGPTCPWGSARRPHGLRPWRRHCVGGGGVALGRAWRQARRERRGRAATSVEATADPKVWARIVGRHRQRRGEASG